MFVIYASDYESGLRKKCLKIDVITYFVLHRYIKSKYLKIKKIIKIFYLDHLHNHRQFQPSLIFYLLFAIDYKSKFNMEFSLHITIYVIIKA